MTQQVIKEIIFDDVFDAQRVFRLVLDGMSRPGKIQELPSLSFSGTPKGMNPSALLLFKTLCDPMVTFGVCPEEHAIVRDYLEINTGSRPCPVSEADYALFSGDAYHFDFSNLKTGTLEFPEDSATAIIAVDQILSYPPKDSTRYMGVQLSGPGIKTEEHLWIKGLDIKYVQSFKEANAAFPLGFDVIFVDRHEQIVCWPRTVKVEVKSQWGM